MNKTDEKITEAVEKALVEGMRLSAMDINIRVKDGIVELAGVVDVLREKSEAESIVKKIAGVKGIENHLTIGTERQVGDQSIAAEVEERLSRQLENILKRVEVKIHQGVVTLEGDVKSLWEKHQAKQLAESVYGITEVKAYLGIRGEKGQDDASLTNRVEDTLAAEGGLQAAMINSGTKNRVVTLKGEVGSLQEIALAWKTVAAVPGVKGIQMELTPRHDSQEQNQGLTEKLRRSLNKKGIEDGVQAFVIGDIAFLSGEVGSIEEKDKAETITYGIKGINGISNDIFIARH